ncbi:hypothetical protein [Peptoniphilus catoniae]|uniref:hypothetical protein n=1 Tax=Peptoniphilus catoniae TaxID=1660341 RepID=UPI0010FD8F31|nr:hypothetical protein [Peptoniphilus catoniae]
MKNNVRGLIFHIFIILIMFLLNILIGLNKTISNFIYGNVIFKLLLALLPIILYYNFAKAMSKRASKRLDFLTGNIIVLVSIIFFIPPIIMEGRGMFSTGVAESIWKFPLDLFLMPGIFIFEILGLGYNLLSLIFASLLPGIIYGISIKKARAKINRRRKIQRMRARR